MQSVQKIRQWIIDHLAEELQVRPETIAANQPILASGIDSMQIVGLVAKLEDQFDFRFTGNPLDDHPTVDALAQYVADLADQQK